VATEGKIDPMHQFLIEPIVRLDVAGFDLSFTNSAMWMMIVLGALWLFMLGGMRQAVVPGRWQVAVEGVYGFIDSMLAQNVGPEGRKFVPLIFSLFMFILTANLIGMMPFGIVPGVHPFTVTSHMTVTGILAILSFGTVLVVGFWRHGLHFFSLFVPHGAPWWMMPIIVPVEFVSFLVRPFSLALRLFVAMTAGHILMKVLAGFIIKAAAAGLISGVIIGGATFTLMVGITALELLVCAIQAYVFALLTSLYLNDAVNLH
jgi:F-type H+-transporting ATPase subunit a